MPQSKLVALASHLASTVIADSADHVDRDARFPKEAVDALRDAQLLSALVPEQYGGGGASLSEVAAITAALARGCASTGMIFAMHQIQVACLVGHPRTPALQDYLSGDVVGKQALLASATTEIGIGGDVRTSSCAVETSGDRFMLRKHAPVISYGDEADAVLVTARRNPDSPASDQVLVLCRTPNFRLEPMGEWDTFGMRGTCSRGFVIEAEDSADLVFPVDYADISSRTMLPVSHVLWGHVWLGLAREAASYAHALVRGQARKTPGVSPPAAPALAELMSRLLCLDSLVSVAATRYDDVGSDPEQRDPMQFAIDYNSVKLAGSDLVLDVIDRSMRICGMAGYRENSEYRLGRLLRDAHSAPIMISNDRILANSAQLLLAVKEQ